MPRNQSRIYLHLLLLFHFAQVLESIWLELTYTLFYVNVDHLVATKVDVRLALMLKMHTFFRVLLQRRVTKEIINLIVTVNVLSTCSLVKHVDYSM